MSQVHKSERGESRFEVMENALKLKRQLRELDYIRNWGLKIREARLPGNWEQWSTDSKAKWVHREADRIARLRALDSRFLSRKRETIEKLIEDMLNGIEAANSIQHPGSMAEADERRLQQCRAIAACQQMLVHLQDIMDTVPIDKNWMTAIEPTIRAEVALLRAWKKSDNEKRREIREGDMRRWAKFLKKCMAKDPDGELLRGIYHATINAIQQAEGEKPEA